MTKIFSSASKLVFLIMAIATVAGMFVGKIESKDFMMLATMAFSFYLTYKPKDSSGEITK